MLQLGSYLQIAYTYLQIDSAWFYYVKLKNLQHYVLNATAVKSKVPQYGGHMSQE
jgi:hypothetical protein